MPSAATGTSTKFAMFSFAPLEFTTDVPGHGPLGQAATNPPAVVSVNVMFTPTADALGWPLLIVTCWPATNRGPLLLGPRES